MLPVQPRLRRQRPVVSATRCEHLTCDSFGCSRGRDVRAMLCRPPTAFALFLKSQKGKLKKFKRVRYTKKTAVFRFDLLKLKFASLMQAERNVHIAASARASDELARNRSLAVAESMTGHIGAPQITGHTVPATAGGDVAFSATAGVDPHRHARDRGCRCNAR